METIIKIYEWLKKLPKAGKIGIPVLACAAIILLLLCSSCSTVGWISNVPNSNASISISNSPATTVQPPSAEDVKELLPSTPLLK